MKSAIVLSEGRGQAVHLREDGGVNLLQAGYLSSLFLAHGFVPRVRFVLDGGQSPEEYSVLCHYEDEEVARLRSIVEHSRDRGAGRRAVVREVRETQLPFTLEADPGLPGPRIADDLFFAPLVARISGVNPQVFARLRAASHPLLDPARIDEYEEMLERHTGGSYLDLEERLARRIVAESCGPEVDVAPVSRPQGGPADWFHCGVSREVIERELGGQERGEAGDDFQARLIGLFASVGDPLGGPAYFNSPTSVRREHGKVRILPRDRFGVLSLAGSERLPFAELRRLIDLQLDGGGPRLLAIKYPYTAHILARQIADEAALLAREGPVKVVFVEGFEGTVNPLTGGYLDQLLRESLPAGVEYHRFVASTALRRQLPILPGALPLIRERLEPLIPDSFVPAIDPERLFG
jgi:hypothetical protein